MSMLALLGRMGRMGRGDLTAHGSRSTFRDWVAETTNHQEEVAEAALVHARGDKVEAAYQRGSMLEKRRRLMADWAAFRTAPAAAGNVTPLLARTAA